MSNVVREESGFVLNFQKGKSYQFGESHIGVVSNLPYLSFNPTRVFSIYLDRIASVHANSDHSSDLLFPSCQVTKTLEASLDKPVSYSVLQKQFSSAVADCNIHIGVSQKGLHCMRRGRVTHAVRAGAPHEVVQKAMRVKSKSMVGYYATLQGKDLAKVSKLAF